MGALALPVSCISWFKWGLSLSHVRCFCCCCRYVAPDVLNQDYDSLSDIWSAGVVMYILLCGHPPFKGSTETGTLRQVKAGVYSSIAAHGCISADGGYEGAYSTSWNSSMG
jgi:serine/threonine protein kinase